MKLLLSILLLVPQIALASFVQQVEVSSASSSTQTLPAMTVTAGDCLDLVAYGPKPSDTVTITGGGTFTKAITAGGSPTSTTVTVAPSTGNTSATLSASWAQATGSYVVWFSDNETRYASFTNGSTAMSWANPLTGSSTTTLQVAYNDGLQLWYEANAAGGSTTITVSASGNLFGAMLQEYSGCATTGALLGATAGLQAYGASGTGGGTDSIRTDAMSVASTPSDVVAFTISTNGGPTSTDVTAGTGYTGRSTVFSTNGAIGFPEDQHPTSGTSFTPTWTATSAIQFSNMSSVALAFKAAGGGSAHPSQMFLGN